MNRIDIGKVLREKTPALARWVPRFLVRWVERLICARKLNEILDLYEKRDPIGFIDGALDYIGVRYELHGTENIPQDGRLLFAANHPLGGVDGMILATGINSVRGGVKLIVNDILLMLEPLRPIFVGVNKHGGQGANFSQMMDELYRSEDPIINFPAGFCSRLASNGRIADIAWRKSFVKRCVESHRVVVPTFVEARNSKFFYRLEKWRTALGIKANLGMVLLPRQVFYQKGKVVRIYFGAPIELDTTHTTQQWCDIIRERVYEFDNR